MSRLQTVIVRQISWLLLVVNLGSKWDSPKDGFKWLIYYYAIIHSRQSKIKRWKFKYILS